jgi:hypothetical protein
VQVELKSTKLLAVHKKRRLAQGNQTVTGCNAFEVNAATFTVRASTGNEVARSDVKPGESGRHPYL